MTVKSRLKHFPEGAADDGSLTGPSGNESPPGRATILSAPVGKTQTYTLDGPLPDFSKLDPVVQCAVGNALQDLWLLLNDRLGAFAIIPSAQVRTPLEEETHEVETDAAAAMIRMAQEMVLQDLEELPKTALSAILREKTATPLAIRHSLLTRWGRALNMEVDARRHEVVAEVVVNFLKQEDRTPLAGHLWEVEQAAQRGVAESHRIIGQAVWLAEGNMPLEMASPQAALFDQAAFETFREARTRLVEELGRQTPSFFFNEVASRATYRLDLAARAMKGVESEGLPPQRLAGSALLHAGLSLAPLVAERASLPLTPEACAVREVTRTVLGVGQSLFDGPLRREIQTVTYTRDPAYEGHCLGLAEAFGEITRRLEERFEWCNGYRFKAPSTSTLVAYPPCRLH